MTHSELVARAERWLRGAGCSLVLTEFTAACAEIPDAVGWKNSGRESLLIECKTSRADFHADKRKSFRMDAAAGMGMYRYFMCEPGVIAVADLPPGWGLLWVKPKVVERAAGWDASRWDGGGSEARIYQHAPNRVAEMTLLYSALSRLRLDLGDAEFRRRVHMPYTARKAARALGDAA